MSDVSFEKLLQLAQQRTLDGKGGLAASITKMCLQPDTNLTPEETHLTFEILRELIGEVEMEVRRYVADYLAHRDDVPSDMLEFLANDTIHVAYPILVHSQQLTDEFLVDLIDRKQRGHHMAVAERPNLSTLITNALIQINDDMVSGKLLENPGAQITDANMDILVERSLDNVQLQTKLLSRKDIPNSIAQRMFAWVGEATRQFILRNYKIDEELANAAIYDAVANAQQEGEEVDASPVSQPPKDKLFGAITQSISDRLYQVLMTQGQQDFISEFAYSTGLTIAVTEMVFDVAQVNTVAIAARAIGFSENQFRDLLKRFLAEKYEDYQDRQLVNKAVSYFNKVSPSKADTYLENWRQSSGSIGKTLH
ncbi:DUF2336 domain-containing protein [Curvivirga sp.]|uniref:DUF2336 domain-containing protein n=1 Tax=Curvivirga sp. TaxID=2856848 RepID=UPI003B5B7BA5